jgi:hypothetical protein
MGDDLQEYRRHLVESRQKTFEAFDRTLLTLSAGGLALSLSMVKELSLGGRSSFNLMLVCWIFWLLSMTCTLVSFFASIQALGKAIEQVDDGEVVGRKVGGRWTTVVNVLNLSAMICFIVGSIFVVSFVLRL